MNQPIYQTEVALGWQLQESALTYQRQSKRFQECFQDGHKLSVPVLEDNVCAAPGPSQIVHSEEVGIIFFPTRSGDAVANRNMAFLFE